MRIPKAMQTIIALLMVLTLLLSLSGCRESAAFVQIIYNQEFDDEVVDDDELIDNDPENEEEEDMFSVAEQDDADTDRGFDESESAYDSEVEESTSTAANATYLDNAEDNGNSTDGTGGSTGTVTLDTTAGNDDDDGDDGGNDEEEEEEEENEGGAVDSSLLDDSLNGNIYTEEDGESDSDGTGGVTEPEEDPEDASNLREDEETEPQLISTDFVYATGNAALLVQMLGGEGVLAGCDSATLSAMKSYFPAEELAGVTALWSGTATGTLLTDVIAQMEELPAYYLYDTTTVSSSAISALTELGVTCVALDFRYATGILNAVETVREVLGTDYANQMAEEYLAFYNGIVNTLSGSIGTYTSGKNYDTAYKGKATTITSTCSNGKSTLFIAAWDSAASVIITRSSCSKTFSGLAVANFSYTNSPISYYMSIAGVENMAAYYASNTGSATYYIYNIKFTTSGTSLTGGSLASTLDCTKSYYPVSGLGGSSYPAIVVASNAIKASIEASEFWQVWDYDTHGGNSRVYVMEDDSELISLISGSYEIYVNPNGLGDWMTGSAESILESAWIAWKFHEGEAYDESGVRSLIAEFYSTFYRCTLTSSQIDAILAGD